MEGDKWENYNKEEIIKDLYQTKYEKNKKQIDIIFNDSYELKEKYKLIKEEKEILLCKENIINEAYNNRGQNYEIKIEELYKGEEGKDFYYINKENLKEKYLRYIFELNKNNNDIKIDNKNEEEMNKLYNEIIMKHPRKMIDNEIKKYSLISWTGFFFCKNNEFNSLGFGIISYFKTLKFFILFFLLISIVNLVLVFHYIKYDSVFYGDNLLGLTTLGNTMTTTYNFALHFYNNSNIEVKDNYKYLYLDCSNKKIGKFITGYRIKSHESISSKIFYFYKELDPNYIKIPNLLTDDDNDNKIYAYELDKYSIENYNEIMKKNKCFLKNSCKLTIDEKYFEINEYNNISNYLIYECIDYSLLPKNSYQNSLKIITQTVTSITAFLLIILYFSFKFAIYSEKKQYYKNKIIINNYVLVLRKLNFNSYDFHLEINDLINHLNDIISEEFVNYNNLNLNNSQNNYKNLNIFDVTISSINEKKKGIIENIKSIQNVITDIKENNDSILKKIKNKIFDAYKSVNILYKNITNKEENLMNEKLLDNIDSLSIFSDKENPLEKEENILSKKTTIKEELTKITDEIINLHTESNQKYFVDIYLTFKNPYTKDFIYKKYKKNKCIRCLIIAFCCNKNKKYYFKDQWLNFEHSNNAPNNIIWENCYILTKNKKKKRCCSFLISFLLFISATVLILILNLLSEQKGLFTKVFIISLCQLVNIFSSLFLEKLTDYEKYSTLTKKLSSNIRKIFILNFLITGISITVTSFFMYEQPEEQLEILVNVLTNMFYSIFSSHASLICKYLYNLFLRYLDSKWTNGKTTKIKSKAKYENLYTGVEFPISQRYSVIFVNLYITCLYGTYCPLIYLFFLLFLLLTFFVDKYLIINYYKNPPYYGNYLSKKTSTFLFFAIILFFYGTIFYLSNPYLFNYYQNNDFRSLELERDAYTIINPFVMIYDLINYLVEPPIKILICNFASPANVFIYYLFFNFIVPRILLFICKIFKKRNPNKYPNTDIGSIYSFNDLSKYYEVKKLELFKLVINYKNKEKLNMNYDYLLNNYKLVIDYLKDNIEKKKTNEKKEQNEMEKIEIKNNNEERLLSEDPSYNLSFIPDYEIYNYFDLLYYI